jgi:hypothetical protein
MPTRRIHDTAISRFCGLQVFFFVRAGARVHYSNAYNGTVSRRDTLQIGIDNLLHCAFVRVGTLFGSSLRAVPRRVYSTSDNRITFVLRRRENNFYCALVRAEYDDWTTHGVKLSTRGLNR